jgi:hypothetical protein
VRGWCEGGKPGLEEFIHDLGAGFERQRALLAYSVARIRRDGVEAVVRWAEGLPDAEGDYKLDVFRNLGTALPGFDLAAARRFCDAHCDGEHGATLRANIAGRWAMEDAPAAMEWLSTNPENWETSFAVAMTYSSWGLKDRQAAIRWMQPKIANGTPPWLAKAMPFYAELVGAESPMEGLALAAALPDVKDREWVTLKLVRKWRLEDEAAAEAWLSKASLSEDLLARIRAPETKVERNHREERERLRDTKPKA